MTRNHRSVLLLLCAAALSSACGENAIQDVSVPLPAESARIKFFNFALGAPGVNFYANDAKMTAVLSGTGTESTVGVNYGGAGASGAYIALTPGSYTLSGRIAAATDKDLPISNLPVVLERGKAYSFYHSGIYDAATKTAESFIVEDTFIEEFDYSVAYVRFVNAISNATQPLTLYAKEREEGAEVSVDNAVAYKSAGSFIAVPPGVYDLRAQAEGATTNALTRAGVSFVGGRVYTITARGSISGSRFLDNTPNR